MAGDTQGAKLTQEKFLAQHARLLQGTGRLFTGYDPLHNKSDFRVSWSAYRG